jgi:MFS family permease
MAFLSPHHRAYRFIVLVLICVLTFGGYYSYDLPGSLSYAYTDPSILNLNAFQYNLLYSVYSWPNTILPFFGGYISDKWLGIRSSTIMFAVLVACGQTLVSLGISTKSFLLIVIGRTVKNPLHLNREAVDSSQVFGLGGESVSVAQSAITARWFKGAAACAAQHWFSVSHFSKEPRSQQPSA